MIYILAYVIFSWVLGHWLRWKAAWLQRLNDVNWDFIVLFFDIVPGFIITAFLYLTYLDEAPPGQGETISARLGRAKSSRGKACAMMVDGLMLLLSSEKNHCANAAAKRAAGES